MSRLRPVADRAVALRGSITSRSSGVTALGWLAIAAALASLLFGLREGWRELVAVFAVLATVLILAVVRTLGRSAYTARIELERTRVTPGEQAMGRVVVTSRTGRSLLPTQFELPVGAGVARFTAPGLTRDEEHEELFSIPARRRGIIVLGPVRSVRGDPFGLFRKEKRWTDPVELYVHPRTVVLDARKSGFLRDIEGVTTQDLSSSDVSFHALRDYVPGDDRRAIHWRTTARVGRLIVRQFEETRRSHLLVALSTNPADYLDESDFEVAVSAAASVALQAVREDRPVTVVTHAGQLRSPSGPALLDQMCGVELGDGGRASLQSDADLVTQAISQVPGASIGALITGRAVSAGQLQRVDAAFPLDVYAFAVRCGPGTETLRRRRVRNLTVLDVAQVDDLPRAAGSLR
ncbi:DUF58 domain-containing protein [Flexivirga caeni]|uniref:DUF58 domain-containing protein n=1 Tax=Flexivirga caeni TaxID=2294115 RepID=UPI0011CD68ED|nr:DUF58 domain-containing protein [Flexivirga caeni]